MVPRNYPQISWPLPLNYSAFLNYSNLLPIFKVLSRNFFQYRKYRYLPPISSLPRNYSHLLECCRLISLAFLSTGFAPNISSAVSKITPDFSSTVILLPISWVPSRSYSRFLKHGSSPPMSWVLSRRHSRLLEGCRLFTPNFLSTVIFSQFLKCCRVIIAQFLITPHFLNIAINPNFFSAVVWLLSIPQVQQ